MKRPLMCQFLRQGQVPTVQAVQKTVEVPQVQFHDRVVEVPVVTQRQDMPSMPRERIQECIVEEIIEVTVSRLMEKIIEGVNPFHRSVCRLTQERRSLTCQVHTFKKKLGG